MRRRLHKLLLLRFKKFHLGLALRELLFDEGKMSCGLVGLGRTQFNRVLSLSFRVEDCASLRRIVGADLSSMSLG